MPKTFKRPKTLKNKNIKKNTGAKAQSKQIAALTRSVSRMNREQFENIRTVWERKSLPIGPIGTAAPYICPIPYVMCDPVGTSPVPGARNWTDSLNLATQPNFTKRMVFGYTNAAENSPKIYHTGGKLRYQIYTNEPGYAKLGMFLIRPKKKQADQIILDRKMKQTSALGASPGSQSRLTVDVDYCCHSGDGDAGVTTLFGSEINRKYWDVLYQREIALSHPLAAGFSNNANANNASPKNNALVASGTINIPAGGVIKNVSTQTQLVGDLSAPAFQVQYLDQSNENGCFLVIIHNDLTLDSQTIDMGFVVTDYYKAVV